MLAWLKCGCTERSKTRKIGFCALNSLDISDYFILMNLNLRRFSSSFACLLIRVASRTLCVFKTIASLSCHLLSSEQWADNSSLVCLAERTLAINTESRQCVAVSYQLLRSLRWAVLSSEDCHCTASFDDLSWIQSF